MEATKKPTEKQCEICHDKLVQVLLQCGHMFCEGCSDSKGKELKCFLCTSVIKNDMITSIVKQDSIIKSIEQLKEQKYRCDCEEKQPIRFLCLDHNELLCQFCLFGHRKCENVEQLQQKQIQASFDEQIAILSKHINDQKQIKFYMDQVNGLEYVSATQVKQALQEMYIKMIEYPYKDVILEHHIFEGKISLNQIADTSDVYQAIFKMNGFKINKIRFVETLTNKCTEQELVTVLAKVVYKTMVVMDIEGIAFTYIYGFKLDIDKDNQAVQPILMRDTILVQYTGTYNSAHRQGADFYISSCGDNILAFNFIRKVNNSDAVNSRHCWTCGMSLQTYKQKEQWSPSTFLAPILGKKVKRVKIFDIDY